MAGKLFTYFCLLHHFLSPVAGGICRSQDVPIYCPDSSNPNLGYCCGESDREFCCSYEESFGITSTNDELSIGAIVGIVVGCVVVCILLGLLAYGLRRLKMKLDERIMERRSKERSSMNRGSMNREGPARGSFKRTSMRTSSRRKDDKEPLNTRESAIFTNDGLTNPGFDDGYKKPLGRTEPMKNGQPVRQNGHNHNGHNHNGYTRGSKDDMEIIGLEDSPKMYDKRKHDMEIIGLEDSPKMSDKRKQWQEFNEPQVILQLEESPKMNEKRRHEYNDYQNKSAVDGADTSMEARLRYHQLLEQQRYEQNKLERSHTQSLHQNGDVQYNQQPEAQVQPQVAEQYQATPESPSAPNNHQNTFMQGQQHPVDIQLQSYTADDVDSKSVPKKKKKTPRRNLPKRIHDKEDSKWSMGYTRETVIQLKRNPSSKCNSPTASKDFDPENPPGILKNRDSEMSDFDSILGDSDQVFHDQSFDRPQSGHFDKLTRRSPSPKQTLAVAPFRQSREDNHQSVPVDQFLTLDPNHLKQHFASYSPQKLSPSQLSPMGREGRYSYFSQNEDFDNSFAKSYPEFIQNKANQSRDIIPHLQIDQTGGRQTPSDLQNGQINSPKEYVDYNRAGEELRITTL